MESLWEFQCDGFGFDAEQKKYQGKIPTDNFSSWIPVEKGDYVKHIVVRASNGEIPQEIVSTTFSKFVPFTDASETYVNIFPDNPFDGKPQFVLEALPSKDKANFYESVIERYINPGKRPEPFDVSIDLVTGDGTVIQTWKYVECDVTDYENYLTELLLITKFHPDFNSEYRERSTFNCIGLHFDPTIRNLDVPLEELKTPSDQDREQVIHVTFSGGGN